MKRKGTMIYLSDDERAILDRLASSSGLSISAYIRIFVRQADREQPTIELPRKKIKKEVAEYV